MWKPDAEDFGGVTSFILSFGGLIAYAIYCDRNGYKWPDGAEVVFVVGAIIAWFLLFVPMSMLGLLIEHGFKRKPLTDEDKRAWKNYKKYNDEF